MEDRNEGEREDKLKRNKRKKRIGKKLKWRERGREEDMEGKTKGGRKGERKGGKKGGRRGGMKGGMKGGRKGWRKGGRKGERKGGRKGGRKGWMKGELSHLLPSLAFPPCFNFEVMISGVFPFLSEPVISKLLTDADTLAGRNRGGEGKRERDGGSKKGRERVSVLE